MKPGFRYDRSQIIKRDNERELRGSIELGPSKSPSRSRGFFDPVASMGNEGNNALFQNLPSSLVSVKAHNKLSAGDLIIEQLRREKLIMRLDWANNISFMINLIEESASVLQFMIPKNKVDDLTDTLHIR